MTIEEIFKNSEDGKITLEQFTKFATDGNAKFVDLSEGKYVSALKHQNELESKDTQINTLNTTIATRDEDLKKLQSQLADAGNSEETVQKLQADLDTLTKKYKDDTANYQAMLSEQAYEFAVKEYANSKKFTSKAAKRDYIHTMLDKKLPMENGAILGADDFTTSYAKENDDAFVVEDNGNKPAETKPKFAQPTGTEQKTKENDTGFNWNFIGVRPMEDKK